MEIGFGGRIVLMRAFDSNISSIRPDYRSITTGTGRPVSTPECRNIRRQLRSSSHLPTGQWPTRAHGILSIRGMSAFFPAWGFGAKERNGGRTRRQFRSAFMGLAHLHRVQSAKIGIVEGAKL